MVVIREGERIDLPALVTLYLGKETFNPVVNNPKSSLTLRSGEGFALSLPRPAQTGANLVPAASGAMSHGLCLGRA